MNLSVGGHLGQLASPTHGQCLAPMGCVLDLTQVVRWLLPWPMRWAGREQGGEGRALFGCELPGTGPLILRQS